MSLTDFFQSTIGRWTGGNANAVVSRDLQFPDTSDAPPDSRRLIRDRRYCQVLTNTEFDEMSIRCAWNALQHEMAYVPAGCVQLHHDTVQDEGYGYEFADYCEQTNVESFYIDRDCITNSDYQRFVQAGGYDQAKLWPPEILSMVLQFTDSSGRPGPRFWSGGEPPQGKADHPVVGICWYEAAAFASWAGKRLPSPAEWQQAGTWPISAEGKPTQEQRYPWGNAFDPHKANLWQNDHSETIPVDELQEGNTPNGIRQLIGNVWEWVDAQFCPCNDGDVNILLEQLMAEVRGAAFDTYFASQATCQFRSGNPVFHRGSNLGFRCCVSTDSLTPRPETLSSEESE
ncbi:MAG: formylglycine-generating enzyme family protein [Planctomycetota bacterium]